MIHHRHKFEIDSTMNHLHYHRVTGITEPGVGISFYHFHRFSGISNYHQHTHIISGHTSPPIKTENGHMHKINCKLKQSQRHSHNLNGYTFEEIEYMQKSKGRTVPEYFL